MNKITWFDAITEEMKKNEDLHLIILKNDAKWLSDDITDWKAIKESNKAVIWTETHIYFRVWENDTIIIRSIPRNPDPDFELSFFGTNN